MKAGGGLKTVPRRALAIGGAGLAALLGAAPAAADGGISTDVTWLPWLLAVLLLIAFAVALILFRRGRRQLRAELSDYRELLQSSTGFETRLARIARILSARSGFRYLVIVCDATPFQPDAGRTQLALDHGNPITLSEVLEASRFEPEAVAHFAAEPVLGNDRPSICRAYRRPVGDERLGRVADVVLLSEQPVGATTFDDASVQLLLRHLGDVLRERIIAERQKLAELRYRRLVENSNDMLWESDRDGRLQFVSAAAERIFGVTPAELIGHSIGKTVCEEQRRDFLKQVEAVATGTALSDLTVCHKLSNGIERHLIYSMKPRYGTDGGLEGLSGTATDVSELLKFELEANTASRFFSAVLDHLPIFFYRIDGAGRIETIRGKGLERIGYRQDMLLGQSLYDLFPGMADHIDRALAGHTVRFESQGINQDRLWWVSSTLFRDDWQGSGAIGLSIDVTESKTAEVKMVGLVRENRALARRLLEIQEEERNNLSRELHDELGQSLTAVRTLATAIANVNPNKTDEIRKLGSSIVDLSAQLYEVVRNLIHRLRPDVIDGLAFEEALQTCINNSRLEAMGVNLYVTITGELDDLNDVVKMSVYRILQESLTNIAKYAMASTVRIRIDRSIQPAEEGSAAALVNGNGIGGSATQTVIRDCLVMEIQDDGVGMDPRGVEATPGQRRGQGLRGIGERVHALGGDLEIVSAEGKGTTIRVSIELGAYQKTGSFDTKSTSRLSEKVE